MYLSSLDPAYLEAVKLNRLSKLTIEKQCLMKTGKFPGVLLQPQGERHLHRMAQVNQAVFEVLGERPVRIMEFNRMIFLHQIAAKSLAFEFDGPGLLREFPP